MVDWPYDPANRDKMYSEKNVPIDKGKKDTGE